jgi:ABC-type long-subunit fatty acid transport system fused permease/ATPase subunit
MRFLSISICIILFQYSFSQSIGGGLAGNIQTESIGVELRAIVPTKFFSVTPQIVYYPFFNTITELYAGIGIQVPFMHIKTANVYALGHASYDAWFNYDVSPMLNAKFHNFAGEIGLGIISDRCLNPFAEYRYNIVFREANIRVGILVDLSCNSGAGYHSGARNSVKCPHR